MISIMAIGTLSQQHVLDEKIAKYKTEEVSHRGAQISSLDEIRDEPLPVTTNPICIASLALVFFCRPFLFCRGRSKVSYMTRLEGACWRVTSNHPRTTLIRGYFQTGSKNSGGNLWLLLRPRLGLSTFPAQERQMPMAGSPTITNNTISESSSHGEFSAENRF